ncbi:MAG: 6-carboxytetrahydropterin synthase QueD [Sphaerochaetaceae bacterium]
MIEVVKEFTFDAAHKLPNHPGKCRQIHGHTYRLQVGFKGPVNFETGMVVDFADIKKVIRKSIVDKLDHVLLNEISYDLFPNHTPTAENMVEWMVQVIQSASTPDAAKLSFIRLYETPTSYAEWRNE